jgi:hypothetical protein
MQTRTERFWKRVGGNENRGNYYGNIKAPLPTTQEMNIMDKYKIIYDVDPPIRKLVIDVARAGFKTIGSCAGHSKNERGFVTIVGNFHKMDDTKRNKLVTIFKNNGLKNIRVYPLNGDMYIRISFDSIGIIKRTNIIKGHESPTSAPTNAPVMIGRPTGVHNKVVYKDTGYIGIASKDSEKLRNANKEQFKKMGGNILIGPKFKTKIKDYEQKGYATQIYKLKDKQTGLSVFRLWISTKKVK